MSRCHSSAHPQVPVTMVSVGLKWCHQCGAWVLIRGVITAHHDELAVEETYDNVEFGPFDTLDDILDTTLHALALIVEHPGRPWVQ